METNSDERVFCVQVNQVNNTEEFNPRRLELLAEDLQAFTEMEEEVFGGDLAEITAAMQEAVDQIDEHIHDIPPVVPGDGRTHLVRKFNDVSIVLLVACFTEAVFVAG